MEAQEQHQECWWWVSQSHETSPLSIRESPRPVLSDFETLFLLFGSIVASVLISCCRVAGERRENRPGQQLPMMRQSIMSIIICCGLLPNIMCSLKKKYVLKLPSFLLLLCIPAFLYVLFQMLNPVFKIHKSFYSLPNIKDLICSTLALTNKTDHSQSRLKLNIHRSIWLFSFRIFVAMLH